jgi:hypothetical protein
LLTVNRVLSELLSSHEFNAFRPAKRELLAAETQNSLAQTN